MPLYRPAIIRGLAVQVLYELIGADMNVTTDQAFTKRHSGTVYQVQNIFVSNPSLSLTTAAGGIYKEAAKGGNPIIPASQAYSSLNTVSPEAGIVVVPPLLGRGEQATDPILSLTTAQGAAATCDFVILGRIVS